MASVSRFPVVTLDTLVAAIPPDPTGQDEFIKRMNSEAHQAVRLSMPLVRTFASLCQWIADSLAVGVLEWPTFHTSRPILFCLLSRERPQSKRVLCHHVANPFPGCSTS